MAKGVQKHPLRISGTDTSVFSRDSDGGYGSCLCRPQYSVDNSGEHVEVLVAVDVGGPDPGTDDSTDLSTDLSAYVLCGEPAHKKHPQKLDESSRQ